MNTKTLKPDLFGMAFTIHFHDENIIDDFNRIFKKSLPNITFYSKRGRLETALNLRLSFDYNILNEVLDVVFDLLQNIKKNVDEFSGIEFFIEYRTKALFKVSCKNLIRLNELFGLFGIALNSINKDWSDEAETYHRKEYYQLILQSKNDSKYLEEIKQKWFISLENKYQNLIDIELNNEGTESNLTISVKDDINQFDWDAPFKDIINLCENDTRDLAIFFGFYQQNRSDMNGGEIGNEIISRLIKHNVDLLCSFGLSGFNHLK